MRVDLVDETTGRVLFTGGGVWDRRRKRYARQAKRSKILRLHPGQIEAGQWFAEWLRSHGRRAAMSTPDGREIWSVCCTGGRRGGKSDLATFKLAVAYAVAFPMGIIWIVMPSFPDAPEVERELQKLIPRHWYKRVGRPHYTYTFVNGSQIFLKSEDDPEDVKRGRCDLAIMNEAQKQHAQTFSHLRPAISDLGGLVVMTANPPRTSKGQWIAEYVAAERAGFRVDKKGERDPFHGKVFFLDPRLNPHVNNRSLLDMKGEVSEREYRIEILGEFLPSEDVVLWAWSSFNIAPVPELGDVTTKWLKRMLHTDLNFDRVVGLDFQRTPHMAGAPGRLFADPKNTENTNLWFDDELIIEQGNEDDMVDLMEARGYDRNRTALIVDASAEWQDVDRTRGKASCDVLRRRGWRHIYLPDAKMKKNPLVEERTATANWRICDAAGERHVFVDPKCVKIEAANRKWENKNGRPSRTSVYAHICDAETYVTHRLYPRRHVGGIFEHEHVPRREAGGYESLGSGSLYDSESMDDESD